MPLFFSSLKNQMKMAAEPNDGHGPRSGSRMEAIRLGVKSSPASTIATAVNLTEVFQ
jgi:hypothetical protein